MGSTIHNFSSEDDITDLEDETLAVNWGRSKTNGIVPIKEKCLGVFAIVDVLHRYMGRPIRVYAPPGDALQEGT